MAYVAPKFVIGCTEVSGNGAVSFFKHDTSNIFGYSNARYSAAGVFCKGVHSIDAINNYFALYVSSTGTFYVANVVFGGTTTLLNINTFSGAGNSLNDAVLIDPLNIYYVGQSNIVNTASPAYTFGQKTGFLMNTDPFKSCLAFSTTYANQGLGGATFLWALNTFLGFGGFSATMNDALITGADILDPLYIPTYTAWTCPNTVIISITPSLIPDQTHDISMLIPTTYTVVPFTLSLTCTDVTRIIYNATLGLDGITPLPVFILFNQLTLVFTFQANLLTQVTPIGTPLTIMVKATAPTGQSAFTSFPLTITNLCGTVGTLVPPLIMPTYVYSITLPSIVQPIPPFISTPLYCKIDYQIIDSGTGLLPDPLLFSMDYILNTITVPAPPALLTTTVDNSKVMNYALTVTAILNLNTMVTTNAILNYDIKHECTLAILNPPLTTPPATFTNQIYPLYQLIPAFTFTLPTFTSDKTTALCGPQTYQLYSDALLNVLDVSVFTFDTVAHSLTVYSIDRLKLGLHNMRLFGYQGMFMNPYTVITFDINIIDPCPLVSTTITTYPLPIPTYFVLQPIMAIPIPLFTMSISYCGPFTYSLSTNSDPTVIGIDTVTNEILIYTSDFLKLSSLTYTVRGDSQFGLRFALQPSSVVISYDCNLAIFSLPTPYDKIYTVYQPKVILSIPYFTSDHPISLCGNINYWAVNADGTILDTIFTFDSSLNPMLFTYQTASNLKAGTYDIRIKGQQSLASTLIATYAFQLQIYPYMYTENLGAPQFLDTTSLKDVSVKMDETFTLHLPKVVDPDNDKYTVSVLINDQIEIPLFMLYQDLSFIFSPMSSDLSLKVGQEFKVTVILSDDNQQPKSSSYSFNVKITAGTPKKEPVQSQPSNATLPTEDQSKVKVEVKQVTETKRVNQYDRFFAVVYSISMKGEMKVKFSEEIIIPKDYSKFDDRKLNIFVISDNPIKLQGTSLIWEVIGFTAKEMTIQLHFSKPNLISNEQIKDKIGITFYSNGDFLAAKDMTPLPYLHDIQKELPPQQSIVESQGQWTQLIANSNTGAVAVVAGSSSISFMMSGSFNLCWAMVNFLQLLLHIVLLSVSYPAKAYQFLMMLVKLANYEIIPTSKIINDVYEFKVDEQPVASVFTEFGYDSYNVFTNLGMILFYSIFFIGLVIINKVLKYFSNKSKIVNKIHTGLNKELYYNWMIRSAIEIYLKLAVCCFIGIRNLRRKADIESLANAAFTVIFALIVLLFPFFCLYFLQTNKTRLKDEDFSLKYETFYGETQFQKAFPRNFHTLFLLRRLILAATVVFLQGNTYLQLFLQVFQSLLFFMYLICFKPFEDKKVNFLESFNEGTILVVSYFLFYFTDFVESQDLKDYIGYFFIGVISFAIAVNWIIVLKENYMAIIELIKAIVRKCKKCKKDREIKKMKNNGKVQNMDESSQFETVINQGAETEYRDCVEDNVDASSPEHNKLRVFSSNSPMIDIPRHIIKRNKDNLNNPSSPISGQQVSSFQNEYGPKFVKSTRIQKIQATKSFLFEDLDSPLQKPKTSKYKDNEVDIEQVIDIQRKVSKDPNKRHIKQNSWLSNNDQRF